MRYQRKKRPQRVRFRRKYATSLVVTVFKPIWALTKVSVFVFLVSFVAIHAWKFWNNSQWIRVDSVNYVGDIPRKLERHLGIKPGQNLFLIKSAKLEKTALDTFPELQTLSIRRQLNRDVEITGKYRTPLAKVDRGSRDFFIDKAGVLFELKNIAEGTTALPFFPEIKNKEIRENWAEILNGFREQAPAFYSRLKQLKTDTIQNRSIIIVDDVTVYWGEFSKTSSVAKAEKVLTILNRFTPKSRDASLRFVNGNRLILGGSWKDTQST